MLDHKYYGSSREGRILTNWMGILVSLKEETVKEGTAIRQFRNNGKKTQKTKNNPQTKKHLLY